MRIFDTTLRDGEQAPGFSMALPEKVRIAVALEALGVDVIEAGFPASSAGDLEAVRSVTHAVRAPVIAGLARCHPGDIATAWDSLRDAERPRLHVFIASSPLHRRHKLRLTAEEVLERVREGVARARSLCDDVEFSAEDATRTEPEFLLEVIAAAASQGASTINLPDTVGYALPGEVEALFRRGRGPAGEATLSAHCHDDIGLAVANSLAAIRGGAGQVECTINGIGERAGNAALEEVAMALRARPTGFGEATLRHGLDTRKLCETSRLIASITGVEVPPNKSVVGRNAFAHEAGIHQHGVLAHRGTYEVLRAEDVGAVPAQIVLGRRSGKHALRARLSAMGIAWDEAGIAQIFDDFKVLAETKRRVDDADLARLVSARRQMNERTPDWSNSTRFHS